MLMSDSNIEGNGAWWRFFDGSISVSASMLVAVLLSRCVLCERLSVVGLIKGLTTQEDGVIIVATLMLFPTAGVLYGGAKLIFAAKEAVEKKAREKGRVEGRLEGRLEGRAEERKQIRSKLDQLEQRGELTPELRRFLED